MAVNRFVYRDEILEPNLLPFIKKYHKHDKYVFWPDQASAHYAKEVQEWLVSKKLNIWQKTSILPMHLNYVQLKIFGEFCQPKCTKRTGLKKKISKCMLEMDLELVQENAGSTQARLDTRRRHGYDAL